MTHTISHEVRQASRPRGIASAGNFVLAQTELSPLQELEVLLSNLFVSADPFNIRTKRLTLEGTDRSQLAGSEGDEFDREVGGYLEAGKLKNKVTVAGGIDQAVGAFIGPFVGKNI